MRKFTPFAALLMLVCNDAAPAAWPWQRAPKEEPKEAPAAVNPFEGKAFIRYPGSKKPWTNVRYLDVYKFLSDTTGSVGFYLLGKAWGGGWETGLLPTFTYDVDLIKKQITIKLGDSQTAYNYKVSGRVISLTNLDENIEWVEASQPFFWTDDAWHGEGDEDGKFARQEAFLKNYIAEARKTDSAYTFSPEHLPLKERPVEAPAPTPAQLVQFLAIPVDESRTKYMLRNVSTGEFRDDRVFTFGAPQSPGQIVSFEGVSAIIVAIPKTVTTGTNN